MGLGRVWGGSGRGRTDSRTDLHVARPRAVAPHLGAVPLERLVILDERLERALVRLDVVHDLRPDGAVVSAGALQLVHHRAVEAVAVRGDHDAAQAQRAELVLQRGRGRALRRGGGRVGGGGALRGGGWVGAAWRQGAAPCRLEPWTTCLNNYNFFIWFGWCLLKIDKYFHIRGDPF